MSRRGWLLFAAMSVIWGVPYLLIKVAVGGVAPPVLVLARVAIGSALLLPIAIRRRELGALRAHWRWLTVFATVEIVIPWLLLSEAETRLSSSLSGLLIASTPIVAALLAWLTGGERPATVRWAGLALGLGGVGLLLGNGAASGDLGSIAEVLAVAVCYATGPLIADRKLGELPRVGMTAACLAFAAVVYAPLAALTWPNAVPAAKVLGAIAGLAVVCTAVAFIGFFGLIAEVGPARATVITYVNPAVAVVLGVAVLGERLTAAMVGAFMAILAGSVLATRAGRTRRAAPAPDREPVPATAAPSPPALAQQLPARGTTPVPPQGQPPAGYHSA